MKRAQHVVRSYVGNEKKITVVALDHNSRLIRLVSCKVVIVTKQYINPLARSSSFGFKIRLFSDRRVHKTIMLMNFCGTKGYRNWLSTD